MVSKTNVILSIRDKNNHIDFKLNLMKRKEVIQLFKKLCVIGIVFSILCSGGISNFVYATEDSEVVLDKNELVPNEMQENKEVGASVENEINEGEVPTEQLTEDATLEEKQEGNDGVASETTQPEQKEEKLDMQSPPRPSSKSSKAEKSIAQPTAINSIFTDAAVAELIRSTLKKSSVSDTVTQGELDSITTLKATNKGIVTLNGLENLPNLRTLDLYLNQISDVSPLGTLSNLSTLNLTSNRITDISPLGNLTSLKILYLDNNNINTLDALKNLTTLEELYLIGIHAINLSALENLTNLRVLDLKNNQINDLEPLKNMISLKRLDLSNNQISDVSSLGNLSNLETLILNKNKINNISPLGNLVTLISLELNNNQLSDLNPLDKLTNLEGLNLGNNQVNDISALKTLTKLKILILNGNQLSEVSALEKLTSLERLELGRNKINEVSSLGNLVNLKNLQLQENQINDISALTTLTGLQTLYLYNNQIRDIHYLSALTNITVLNITNQSINLPEVNWSNPLNITNTTIDENGNLISPSWISEQGVYDGSKIIWTDLNNDDQSLSYKWSKTITVGKVNSIFSGTISVDITKLNYYSVSFVADGTIDTNSVATDDLLIEPAEPIKSGYTFKGWYDELTNGKKWDFASDKMPAQDLTLYAQFNINSYTATFNADGKVVDDQKVNYENLVTESVAPVKQGYTFKGWYDDPIKGKKWDFASDKMPAKDVNLYAQYVETPISGGGVGVKPPSVEPAPAIPTESKDGNSIDSTNRMPTWNQKDKGSVVGSNLVYGQDNEKKSILLSTLPKTGEDKMGWAVIILGVVLLMSGFGLLLFKRKKVHS
ncbi:LPXTG cell wall anchor domain-containing protein [Listeria monocytogenes]|nr:LPXTG cell wall anchor domain-containing protein [Listeria monocytogenes]